MRLMFNTLQVPCRHHSLKSVFLKIIGPVSVFLVQEPTCIICKYRDYIMNVHPLVTNLFKNHLYISVNLFTESEIYF